MISVVVHAEWDLTEVLCKGLLDMREVIEVLRSTNSDPMTGRVLWDLTGMDYSSTRGVDLPAYSAAITSFVRPDVRRKSALLAGNDLAYGLCRMYQSYHETAHPVVPLRVFRVRQEAIDWLLS